MFTFPRVERGGVTRGAIATAPGQRQFFIGLHVWSGATFFIGVKKMGFIDTETRAHIRAALTKRAKLRSASALRCGLEHLDAAAKCRASLPDRDSDPDEHHRVLREIHAHVKAADQFLETARNGAPPVAEDGDDDAELADALTDPEVRATIETTRAAAAATLIAAGETHAAKRLVHKPTQPRR